MQNVHAHETHTSVFASVDGESSDRTGGEEGSDSVGGSSASAPNDSVCAIVFYSGEHAKATARALSHTHTYTHKPMAYSVMSHRDMIIYVHTHKHTQ